MRQEILRCTISIAVELSITPKMLLCNRVSKDAFERLEPYAGELARTVLRGLGAGNRARLPDPKDIATDSVWPRGQTPWHSRISSSLSLG